MSETPQKKREPLLWWIAGADPNISAQCPRADQIFVQHLGLSLVGAFVFVFSIATISILVAFPDLTGSTIGIIIAPSFAFLIAAMVFLVDRLFIQYDWDCHARRERDRAALSKATAEAELSKLELTPPPLPSDRNTKDVDDQICEKLLLIISPCDGFGDKLQHKNGFCDYTPSCCCL